MLAMPLRPWRLPEDWWSSRVDARYVDFIRRHLERSPNVVFVVLARDGALIDANRGFRTLVSRFGMTDDPSHLFQVPAFEEIVQVCDKSDGGAMELSVTIGDPHRELFSLSVSVQASTREIVCMGEIDRDEIVRLNRSYEAMSNEIQELNRALVKRELLLRETNHRVKNNLLILSSLIRLRRENPGHASDWGDVLSQVDAIRVLHDLLSAPEAANEVQANAYIRRILDGLFELSGRDVRLDTDIRLKRLPAARAVAVGLLINEIATNALKHSFIDSHQAFFSAELRAEQGSQEHVLVLSHSGPRIPESVDPAAPKSLGMALIKAFAEQLRGTVELKRQPTTTYTIRFPAA